MVARSQWNKGIATNAIKSITDHCFGKLNLVRLQAHVHKKNKISAHVLEKNGYKKEGLIKKHTFKNGKYIDCFLYAKMK